MRPSADAFAETPFPVLPRNQQLANAISRNPLVTLGTESSPSAADRSSGCLLLGSMPAISSKQKTSSIESLLFKNIPDSSRWNLATHRHSGFVVWSHRGWSAQCWREAFQVRGRGRRIQRQARLRAGRRQTGCQGGRSHTLRLPRRRLEVDKY